MTPSNIFRPAAAGRRRWSFRPQAYILPYVEQNGLYAQLDLKSAPTSLVIGGVSYSGANNALAASQTGAFCNARAIR